MDLRQDQRAHARRDRRSWPRALGLILASDGFSDYAGSRRGAHAVTELTRDAADADGLVAGADAPAPSTAVQATMWQWPWPGSP